MLYLLGADVAQWHHNVVMVCDIPSQCCHMKDETNFRNVGFKLAIHMNIWNYDYGIIRAWTKHGEPTQLNHNWLAALL